MTKKERVIAAIQQKKVSGIPSSFSLHFPADVAFGKNAVKSHLDFFKATDTDILKIMNENLVPFMGKITNAAEYGAIRALSINDSFMQDQLTLTREVLKSCEKDTFTMGTLHGVTASSIHPLEKMGLDYDGARAYHVALLREDEKAVLATMQHIADGMSELARAYIAEGVDSVYYAALGAENRYFTDEEFAKWIRPFDIQIMQAIRDAGGYCFLHICKDELDMNRYEGYAEYADVVNWGVYEAPFSLDEGKKFFGGKTIMGGLKNRRGVLIDGSKEEIEKEVQTIIESFGSTGFILGADCTLATEQDVEKVRWAVEAARAL